MAGHFRTVLTDHALPLPQPAQATLGRPSQIGSATSPNTNEVCDPNAVTVVAANPEAVSTLPRQAAMSPGAVHGAGAADGSPLISGHTLLRRIGHGAYGEVWLARDVIGSLHAVKIIRRRAFDSDAPFEREFRGIQRFTPISRSHPGFVHVLHVDRNDGAGYFYYVMEAGDDERTGQEIDPATYQPRSLATEMRQHRRLPIRACLEIGIALADALDYLHGQLLVHRDIKPSNVIFVHGLPKVADVGLVTEVRSRDREVSLLGTVGYMAPEGPGTAAADLYSLGKLLYEISTGRDRLEFPLLSGSLVEGINPELQQRWETVLRKICHEDPQQRHQSGAELREDLRRLQALLP